jgi:hypothetical protein
MSVLASVDTPWELHDLDAVGDPGIPSMTEPAERRYLYWLARHQFTGRGAIIDAGSLLGASTANLAEGLRQNPGVVGKAHRIHSYDLFEYARYMRGLFAADAEPMVRDSLLPRFLSHIHRWREMVVVHPGDIKEAVWTGGPIEILFIDLAKTWEIQTHLLREFFPSLIPGVSIVVQQDYFHYYCYWITLVMEYLADYFTPVHMPGGGTLGFALTREVPSALLERDYERFFSRSEAEGLFARAAGRYTGARRLLMETAKAAMLSDYGDLAAAVETLEAIPPSPDRDAMVAGNLMAAALMLKARIHSGELLAVPQGSTVETIVARLELVIADARHTLGMDLAAPGDPSVQLVRAAAAAGRPIYLWGAGQRGRNLLQALRERSVPVSGFVDRDPRKTGLQIEQLRVSMPAVLDHDSSPPPFVGVTSQFAVEIAADLNAMGWTRHVDYVIL